MPRAPSASGSSTSPAASGSPGWFAAWRCSGAPRSTCATRPTPVSSSRWLSSDSSGPNSTTTGRRWWNGSPARAAVQPVSRAHRFLPLPHAEPAPGGPEGPLASRPALGAHRRKAKSEPDAPTSAPMDSAPPRPALIRSRIGSGAGHGRAAAVARRPRRGVGDHIIGRLSPRAKALFIAGRFIEVDDAGAVFALPNAAHLEHAKDSTKAVEAALEEHFGSGSPPTGHRRGPAGCTAVRRSPARSGTQRTDDPADLEDDDFDPTDAGDSVRVETVAEARLLEAFPGAEEVTS